MAYNPYGLTRVAPPPSQSPAGGRYALTRQPALTQNGQMEEDQNAQGLRTGQFADVQSAAAATQRANAMRTSQGLQAARGTIARSGDMSPEAAIRAQDQALSQASAQNLNATNAVNGMQRQYRQDALNRAGAIEDQAYGRATDERNYKTAADQYADDQAWKGYDANVNEESRLFGENNTLQQQDQSQMNNTRDYGEGVRRYDLGRQDSNSQFAVTSGQNQQQIDNQVNQFGVTSGQNQQQINNQASQFQQNNLLEAQRVNQGQQQIDNQANQFGVTSGQNQQQINNQASQFQQNYSAGREDAATQKDQFGQTLANNQSQFAVTSGQNQQQINNQASQFAVTSGQNQQQIDQAASQFAEKMGYDYASLSQQDKEYFANLAQNQGQFDVTSGQNQQQINNQANQFGVTSDQNQQQINNQALEYNATLADSQNKFNLSRQDANSQFAVTSGQNQQQINNQTSAATYAKTMDAINAIQDPKARQAAYNTYMQGGDVSQFISGTLYDSTGGLNQQYQSASPGTQAYQAKIDELKSYYPDKTDAQIQKMAEDERAQDYTLTRAPAVVASQQLAADTAAKNLASLPPGVAPAQSDLDTLTSVNPQAIPMGSAEEFNQWMAQNQTGGWTKIAGQAYQLGRFQNIGGGDGGDFVPLTDAQGNTKYLLHDGSISNTKPAAQTAVAPIYTTINHGR